MKHLAVPRNYALHLSAPPPPVISQMASAHILKFRLFSPYAVNHSALSMIGGGQSVERGPQHFSKCRDRTGLTNFYASFSYRV